MCCLQSDWIESTDDEYIPHGTRLSAASEAKGCCSSILEYTHDKQ